MPNITRHRSTVAAAAVALLALVAGTLVSTSAPGAAAATSGVPSHRYRANDYADGQAMSILPPGENGLVSVLDALRFKLGKKRPAHSQDQLAKYENLLYGYRSLTDAGLGNYFDDESFGVRPGDITRTERPGPGVTIYRDQHDVPHVYASNDAALAFGAGYAQAEDRLFLMDVLRHYGEGTLASFLGGSCAFEQMDHDQLLLAPYTRAQAIAQVDALPREYGEQGALAKEMIENYVRGVNRYIRAALTHPKLLPADYAAAAPDLVPHLWGVQDVVAIAGLIGGIFGRGGGAEVTNAALLQYLQKTLGAQDGAAAFRDFRTANDPAAPTTADKSFRYELPGAIDPATTAMPDDASAPLTGGPVDTDPNCDLTKPNPKALKIIDDLGILPAHMSNALVVNADKTVAGHPIAVFGPQVSYYAPQILSELDLHSPDYAAEGASFPGTGIVELGRGEDFAWSATSAGTDLIDQRLELICNPDGGAPAPQGKYYLMDGKCKPMVAESFKELALPKVGGLGAPAYLDHKIYLTDHGIVQGWTTADGGKPVAVVNQRSTYGHDVDSIIGFLGWGQPKSTYNVRTFFRNAAKIGFTFNWFYVDSKNTGYFVSGLDPVRPSDVNPDLPTWGTGDAEWQGFLPPREHVHEINPPQGFFVSWNNKPAPEFAAADNQYGYGQVYRSVLLVDQLDDQLAAHGGKLTRANVVQAMETAASQDLDGVTVLPLLLKYLHGRTEPAGVQAMLDQLSAWIAGGAHRVKARPGDTQYQHAAAVAIADELMPKLAKAFYDPILGAGGYRLLPMPFVQTPDGNGAHQGSSYDGGYESYLVASLQQLMGLDPVDGFGPEITSRECAGGPDTCAAAIDEALRDTYDALVTANRSADVASWTASTASAAAQQTMPEYDAIQFETLGLVGQPAIDWQNRPTFQQVVQFPRHRPWRRPGR